MNPVKIGNFIAKLRRDKNMTQEQLGEAVGVTNKTVSRWENGNYMPTIEMLQILSRTFDVSINELLAGGHISNEDFRRQADQNLIDVVKRNSVSAVPFKQLGIFNIIVFLCGFCMFILNCFIMDAASYMSSATYISAVMMIVPSIYYLVVLVLQIKNAIGK